MNPILRKDLLGLLRLPRTAVIQLAFVAVLAALVLTTWPQQGVVSLATRGQDALLLGLILGQIILMALVVPGASAVAISSEREQGTLEMIYASRLSPSRFILGKLLSTLSFPLLLLVSALPFVALLIYRGDVDLPRMGWAYAVVLMTAALLAMMSLAISALCSQSSTALVAAYVGSLFICGVVLTPAAIMLATQGGLAAQVLHYGRSISPVAAALSLLRPGWGEFGGRAGGIDEATGLAIAALRPSWQVFFPSAGAAVIVCLLVTIVILRRPPIERVATARPQARRTLLRRLLFLIDPNKQRKPIGWLNPLVSKESRTNPLRSGGWMIRIFYAALFVALGLALMAMTGGQTEHGDLLLYTTIVLVTFQICVIALVAPSLTSPAISSEVENGTFEMLRLTPLRAGSIFWGKFLPAVLPALLPIAAMLPAYATICFVDPGYLRSMLRLMPIFLTLSLLCCALGLLCSSLAKATARATIAAYMAVIVVIVLPLVAWLASGPYLDPMIAQKLSAPSPLVAALAFLPGATRSDPNLWQNHLVLMAALIVAIVACARLRLEALVRRG